MMNFTTDLAVNGDFREGFLYCNRLDGGMTSFHTKDEQMSNCLGVEHDHHRPEAATDGGGHLRGPSKVLDSGWVFAGWMV